ncbi:MAG: RNA polymerase factor sigma-54 [Phycisphaerae bacterium]
MSQFLTQVPRQMLRQEQRLTPQLIQAMDILQLPLLALEARIAQELDSNPALEMVQNEQADPDGIERLDERNEGESDLIVRDGDAEDFARLDNLFSEYDYLDDESDYRGTRSRAQLAEDGNNKFDAMQNTAARPQSLHDYLLDQWRLLDLTERDLELGEVLISHVDSHGRIESPLDEIAEVAQPASTPDELLPVLRKLQTLDPPGIAARSVQESLLLQLRALPEDTELEKLIIRDHYTQLQKNRIPQIAKALDVEIEDINDAIANIARLRLNPAAEIVEDDTPVIVPDVIVEYNEETDAYDVRLARGNSRELRISPEFRAALERSREDKKTRAFIKEKIEAAGAILDALRFRRDRLLEVAKAVVAAQRDFLDHGEQHLKILRMSELAERFDCDPSTISRTVDEKYLQTPRGVYPLRRFFTGGTSSAEGEEIGWDSIKAKVEEIIENEDKHDPLNDDQIVDALLKAGIDIKRRTVAKYRAQLGIPPARQRRQY